MRNFYPFFLFIAFWGLFSPCFAETEKTTEKQSFLSRSYNIVKSASSTTCAIGLALCAHIITEWPIVYSHELGHSMGDRLSGGNGGRIEMQCNLSLQEPLSVLMPFFGSILNTDYSFPNLLGGPIAGIATNYGIMLGVNALQAKIQKSQKDNTWDTIVKKEMHLPWTAYKNLANEIADTIIKRSKYQALSFTDTFVLTFNLLKTTKMFGEFVYGLTPFSILYGDGDRIWKKLGLKKDLTVSEMGGLTIAITPAFISLVYGIAKGVYQSIKNQEIN